MGKNQKQNKVSEEESDCIVFILLTRFGSAYCYYM